MLGTIVVAGEMGLEVIDRLPAEMYEASATRQSSSAISDALKAASNSPLIDSFVTGIDRTQEEYRVEVEASNVEQRRITAGSSAAIKRFLISSRSTVAARSVGDRPMLVWGSYTGAVRITFDLQDVFGEKAGSALANFELTHRDRNTGRIVLMSTQPVEFAHELRTIEGVESNMAELVELNEVIGTESKWGSAWEAQSTADAPPEQFHRVQVFYATDRNLAPLSPGKRRESIALYFVSFFTHWQAYVLLAVLFVVVYLILWLASILSRLALAGQLLVIATVFVLWFVVASIHTWQRATRSGAIDRQEIAAHRGELTYGTCDVSIPKNHKIGVLDRPISLFLVDFEPEDPTKHVTVLGKLSLTEPQFFEQLRARLKESPERECFVFVHGYNNSFDDAARRTAQLWYDLQYPGAPIFFSWPSRAAEAAYSFDENEAAWAQSDFEAVLQKLHDDLDVKRIHVIAHSMGNRIVSGAMGSLSSTGVLQSPECKFREIILAAADIDAQTFKRDIAPKFTNRRPHVTLYASNNDAGLKLSWRFHDYPRAGDARQGILVLQGMDSVDASHLDTSFDNHGYFAAQRTVVSDIQQMILNGLPPNRRGLIEQGMGNDKYWAFRP